MCNIACFFFSGIGLCSDNNCGHVKLVVRVCVLYMCMCVYMCASTLCVCLMVYCAGHPGPAPPTLHPESGVQEQG